MIRANYFFLEGTFFPSRRASDSPMAMACLGLVTFFPLRPDFSLPRFIACISRSTSWPAEGEYLRPEDFFELDFFADDPRVLFFELLLRVLFLPPLLRVLFFALLRDERLELPREELRFEVLDFFLAAFLVAITILLGGQMAGSLKQVACARRHKVA
jgi:hypothetical protein